MGMVVALENEERKGFHKTDTAYHVRLCSNYCSVAVIKTP